MGFIMTIAEFKPRQEPEDYEALRHSVRGFLSRELHGRAAPSLAKSWMSFDAGFSRKLGEQGWIGVTLPKRYGGMGAGPFARHVISEELLAASAPVSAHWIADRQSGPLILHYGTDMQRESLLPRICRGELYFCIGMSEPNAGSDLAGIITKARRDGDEWVVNGAKLWTTNAHRSHYMIALVLTGDRVSGRHSGLSQLLIDLSLPGVQIRPIKDLTGAESFNEVVFTDLRLPADALIGQEGRGWDQVTAELAFERSGPERYLSSVLLLRTLIKEVGVNPDSTQASVIGRLVARLCTLRHMSLAVAAKLQAGEDSAMDAAIVKDFGTAFEQEIPELAHLLDLAEPTSEGGTAYSQTLALLMQMAPAFSIRGGTRQIIRGIIARGLGLR
jgi:alkylation response protein AidB-like acyl-CoA dehydrogenase